MSALELSNVSFAYSGGPPIVTDFSLECAAGESVLVLGDNGSGKSTLGRVIGGLLRPQSGTVVVGGRDLTRVPVRERPRLTMYVSQVSYLQFFTATIADEIALAARQAGAAPPDADATGMFALPEPSTNPRDLTYPQMWRLQALLLGLIFQPTVLYIDEVVAPGLPDQRQALRFLLGQRRASGSVTLLAYQRTFDDAFDRTVSITAGVPGRAHQPAGRSAVDPLSQSDGHAGLRQSR